MHVDVRLNKRAGRRYKLIRFNPAICVDNLEIARGGPVAKLLERLEVKLETYSVRWLTFER